MQLTDELTDESIMTEFWEKGLFAQQRLTNTLSTLSPQKSREAKMASLNWLALDPQVIVKMMHFYRERCHFV